MPVSGDKRTNKKKNNYGSSHLTIFRFGQVIDNISQFCSLVSGAIIYSRTLL